MKVVITGGCGFIGSNFIHRFMKHHPDATILNLDLLTYAGNSENTKTLINHPNYSFLHGSICDAKIVDQALKGADAVINFAAETHVDRSIDDPQAFLHTNILGVKTLLDSARTHCISRFLHISTDEVYGSVETGYCDEEAPIAPNSPYSAAKAAGDLLVRSYWKTYRYPAIIARSSNNFGPFQFPEKVIPLFITNLLEDKKVPLYGQGLNRREWTFVDDNCDALELVFFKGTEGEIYNISSGNEMTNLQLTHAILKTMHKGEDHIEYVTDRPGHDLRYALNTKKIQRLGFSPQHRFHEALEATIQWYMDHPEWWRPLKRDKFTVK